MKHIKHLTKPAAAFCVEGHPSIIKSIVGLVNDPVGTLKAHLDKQPEA